MQRMTIDYGIDLGTTNSAISISRGTDIEIIKNNEGMEYTPSAVFIDKNSSLIVGRRAKERIEVDRENAHSEFKLQMGTDAQYLFARSGRRMRPEELSAEVLKSLKADVKQRTGDEVQAAVITVPAAFELPQCKATNDAAQLAGIRFSPLLQEPVAAALAYGFQSDSDKVFWLVYDLGGGTFDAAVIQMRDGVIQVVNHGGDNQLGGKLIDWAIVEQILIPAVNREYRLTDFRRGNPKWSKAMAKLKHAAEDAKIRVSRNESIEIMIDSLCQDDQGENITFEYDLTKSEVERMAEPFIVRSINICRKVLTERKLGLGNVERVLLVGGPTMTPYLRDRLADPKEGLGIPLDFSLDPLTVVARGAAIFAGSQRDEGAIPQTVAAGQYRIDLQYKPVSADPEPLIGGQVIGTEGQDLSRFTIEFVNQDARPQWRSGQIPLAANGSFMTSLWAEKGKTNAFQIILSDAQGSRQQTVPDSLPYTVGVSLDGQMLLSNIGVGLADNETKIFLEKGTQLPAKKRFTLTLAEKVRKGEAGDAIRIPLVEGEHRKADRNQLIGIWEINGTQLKRDLPPGSEVELTIEMNQSRLILSEAFLPIIDTDFQNTFTNEKKIPQAADLEREVEREKQRLDDMRSKVQATSDFKAQLILDDIEQEHLVEEMETALEAARGNDESAAEKCDKDLRGLKAKLDDMDSALQIPGLLAEAEQIIEWTQNTVNKYGKASEKTRFESLQRELRATMSNRVVNANDLRMKIDQMDALRWRILFSSDEWWVGRLAQLEEYRSAMSDQALADKLFTQAMRAVNSNNIEGVKAACRQLNDLLPDREQEAVGTLGGNLR